MDYQHYEEILADCGAAVDVAEVHGELCGRLCALGERSLAAWLEESLQAAAGDDGRQELAAMHARQWRQLQARDPGFQPLLPPDERPLSRRVEGLALWCQGFLRGLVQGRLPGEAGRLQRDFAATAEVMGDFERIVHTALSAQHATTSPEESEADYAELVEYLRVATQTVFEDLESWRRRASTDDAR